jgi:predicted RNA-binding Zn-ribbon protein involved in translation (DUF1610 family)
MKVIGILLLVAAIGLFIYGFYFETLVEVEGTKWKVHNIGLVEERRMVLAFSGILGVLGVVLILVESKREPEVVIKTEKDFFCVHCGSLIELDNEDIEKRKYYCPECGKENIITVNT